MLLERKYVLSLEIIIVLFVYPVFPEDFVIDEVGTRLELFNDEYARMWWLHQSADWNYTTNITSETALARQYASVAFSDWMREWKLWARKHEGLSSMLPPQLKRDLDIIASGVVFMNADDARIIADIKSRLTKLYSSASVYVPGNKSVVGESAVIALAASIREPDVLKNIWKTWRKEVGEKGKQLFIQLIQLSNKATRENGYSDVGEAWRAELGLDDVISTILKLWNDVEGFYKQLHSYTRHKLRLFYGQRHFPNTSLIPAHLLGSLWGENWSALSDILQPYPRYSSVNITSIFRTKSYTVDDVVRKADEMYGSMGFEDVPLTFWTKSMFEEPNDGRIVDCHSVSYDFALNNDFRIRMCGSIDEQSFLQAVHEMGHIHYYMAYHHLPMLHRNGANSAFHEAVGETMVYAAQNPRCLKAVNILDHVDTSTEQHLNILMKQALSKFVLLPFALTIELWRYKLFAGQIEEDDMNKKWWELRKKLQGIEPPDEESINLFDAGSKYHVLHNIPYLRYFLSRFLEHQFLESLCEAAGKDNLHACCFFTSRKAGNRFKSMLSLGSSVSWQDALQAVTGDRELSSAALLRYYKPLHDWLKDYNIRNGIAI